MGVAALSRRRFKLHSILLKAPKKDKIARHTEALSVMPNHKVQWDRPLPILEKASSFHCI